MRILYVCGIVPDWPAALRPLPPLDSGAPHGNILRLVEKLSEYHQVEITVISAVSPSQFILMNNRLRENAISTDYKWITLSDNLRLASAWIRSRLPITEGIFQRLLGGHSLQALAFLRGIKKIAKKIKPDLVILDDSPQYIRGLVRFIPRQKMAFYCRGNMGSSRKYLHLPGLLMVTNTILGEWLRSVNPGVTDYAVIPNSLPDDYLNIQLNTQRFLSSPKNILFVGRVIPDKGIQYLINACAKVMSAFPGARLIIVGSEHPLGKVVDRTVFNPFEQEMRELTHQRLPAGCVEWTGWLSGEALRNVYQQAYLAVYPSTLVEGFGMVALEAMACGTPVIVSDRPGFRSLVEHGGGVMLKDPTDTDELACVLLELLNDPGRVAELSQQATLIARRYTVERAAEAFMAAIKLHIPATIIQEEVLVRPT
jgi:glycosyltransferase involved in cell wall biosynthesis